jgi:hypothetical protein
MSPVVLGPMRFITLSMTSTVQRDDTVVTSERLENVTSVPMLNRSSPALHEDDRLSLPDIDIANAHTLRVEVEIPRGFGRVDCSGMWPNSPKTNEEDLAFHRGFTLLGGIARGSPMGAGFKIPVILLE